MPYLLSATGEAKHNRIWGESGDRREGILGEKVLREKVDEAVMRLMVP